MKAEAPERNHGDRAAARAHTPVDFFGKLKGTPFARYDPFAFVAEDGGFFDTRDELMQVPGAQNSKIGKLIFERPLWWPADPTAT